jgi:hypothetical protein
LKFTRGVSNTAALLLPLRPLRFMGQRPGAGPVDFEPHPHDHFFPESLTPGSAASRSASTYVQVRATDRDGGTSVGGSLTPLARFLLVDSKPDAGHIFARKFLAWSMRENERCCRHVNGADAFGAANCMQIKSITKSGDGIEPYGPTAR